MAAIDDGGLAAALAQMGVEWWRVDLLSKQVEMSANVRGLLGVGDEDHVDADLLLALRPFPPGVWRTFESVRRGRHGRVRSRLTSRLDQHGRLIGVFGLEAPDGDHRDEASVSSAPTADEHLLGDIMAVQTAWASRYTLDGHLVWCNEQYAAHLRSSPEELLGVSWLDRAAFMGFDTQENLATLLSRLVEATADGAISTVVAPMWQSDAPRWIQWTNRRVVNPDGGEELLQAIGVEVTELRATRDALAHLTHHLVRGRVDERRALARRIHDDVIQVLVSAGWLMAPDADGVVPTEVAERSVELVQLAVEQLRELLGELTAPPVLLGSLTEAVQAEAESMRAAGVEVLVHLEELLDEELRTVCTRVLMEGMRNVARRDAATRVEVTLRHVGDEVVGQITDNGVGIIDDDLTAALAAGHVGLMMARAMVESIGGTLEMVNTSRSEGARLMFRIPSRVRAVRLEPARSPASGD